MTYDAVVVHDAGTSTEPTLAMVASKEFSLARATVYAMRKHGLNQTLKKH
jgi:hypothetical protein